MYDQTIGREATERLDDYGKGFLFGALAGACLVLGLLWAANGRLTPDEDDCKAQGRPASCWQEGAK